MVYSLGNFLSGQRPRYRDGGAMLWLELQKVRKDSIEVKSIHNVEYELEWVRKSTTGNKFSMLPIRYFERDSTEMDFTHFAAMRQFVNDSRTLFQSRNLNVSEKIVLNDSAFYRIACFTENAGILDTLTNKYPFEKDNRVNDVFWIGRFNNEADALVAALEIQELIPDVELKIRKFVVR